MAKLTLDITTSLDGFIAGPDQTFEQPLGAGGERLRTWLLSSSSAAASGSSTFSRPSSSRARG